MAKHNATITNQWLADRLYLGHIAGMWRNLSELMQDPAAAAIVTRLEFSVKSSP